MRTINSIIPSLDWDFLSVCKLRISYRGYGFCKDCIYYSECAARFLAIYRKIADYFVKNNLTVPNSINEFDSILNCPQLSCYFWENICNFDTFRNILIEKLH